MPRVNDVMQLPPGTYGAPNTKIQSAKYNTAMDDLVNEMNGARPVSAGGTGGNTPQTAREGIGAFSTSGGTLTGDVIIQKTVPRISLFSANGAFGWELLSNVSNTVDGEFKVNNKSGVTIMSLSTAGDMAIFRNGRFGGDAAIYKNTPVFSLLSPSGTNGWSFLGNVTDSVNGEVKVRNNGTDRLILSATGDLTITGGLGVGGDIVARKNVPQLKLRSPNGLNGWDWLSNVTDGVNDQLQAINSNGNVVIRATPAGNVTVLGALAKGSGTFLIDHPLDPLNKDLLHGFVEAPRYDLIYRGTAKLKKGKATVDIDAASALTSGTFAALTTNAVVTGLQNQDGFARLRPGPITGAKFDIISEDAACTDTVSWVVIAERNDAYVRSGLEPNTDENGRFVPERDKEE